MKRFDRLNIILELAIILVNITTIVIAISKYNSVVPVSAEEKITITEFSIPDSGYSGGLQSIIVGSDNNLWFTESNRHKIGRITTNGTVTEFPLVSEFNIPFDITFGPDGNLWFTEQLQNGTSKIGRMTPSGVISEFPLTTGGVATHITSGPDGNIWFSIFSVTGTGKIGRITPGGTITEFPLISANKYPSDLTSGPDGNIWFIEDGSVSPQIEMIAKITTEGNITEFQLPSSKYPMAIIGGSDGNVWFTEGDLDGSVLGGWIAKITPEGIITEYSLPRLSQVYGISLHGIVKGLDGNMWFTEGEMNQIGMITLDGKIVEYTIPTENSGARAITFGPDGNVWFTELFADKIGRVNLAGVKEPPGQNKDDTLLSPFNNGVTWSVSQGYLNNQNQSEAGCHIGLGPDHCRNQLFGLDMVSDQQSDTQILAPGNGKVAFTGRLPDENCLGVKITLDNGLNLNVCHFATFNVRTGDRVLRGKVLGTRSSLHVHLSLDDRYRIGTLCPGKEHCYLPIPFDGQHTIDGIAFDPDINGETVVLPYPLCDQRKNISCQFKVGFQQYKGFKGTSTNIAIP